MNRRFGLNHSITRDHDLCGPFEYGRYGTETASIVVIGDTESVSPQVLSFSSFGEAVCVPISSASSQLFILTLYNSILINYYMVYVKQLTFFTVSLLRLFDLRL
jgi:hypothetical protein